MGLGFVPEQVTSLLPQWGVSGRSHLTGAFSRNQGGQREEESLTDTGLRYCCGCVRIRLRPCPKNAFSPQEKGVANPPRCGVSTV